MILGGDDMDDHGSVDGGGNAVNGWLYIQRAIENIGPNVTRSGNDGSIAALGSAAGSIATSSDAGASIDLAGSKTGRTVTHYEGAAAIDTFFTNLASAATNPAIIHLAGDQATNDLSAAEKTALTSHAAEIASFVSSGGGLFSHGTYYGWLTALLPGASAVASVGNSLYFTGDGLTDLPGLTVGNINAGPWHSHFEGDLGGLKVLVRSSAVQDNTQTDAALIIGGSQVTFDPATDTPTATATSTSTTTSTATSTATSTPTATPTNTATATPTDTATPTSTATATATFMLTPTATASPRIKTHTPTNSPTSVATSTNTPAAAVATNTPAPAFVSDRAGLSEGRTAGAIVGPNTGDGPGAGSWRAGYAFAAIALIVAGGMASTLGRRPRRR